MKKEKNAKKKEQTGGNGTLAGSKEKEKQGQPFTVACSC